MNILVIDARTRGLTTFVASATKVDDGEGFPHRLVLRHGLEIGPRIEGQYNLPILVMGSYYASSSAGFAECAAVPNYGYGRGSLDVQNVEVIGMGGIPMSPEARNDNPSLRVCVTPIKGVIVSGPHTEVQKLKTFKGSNPQAVSAAMKGFRVRAEREHDAAFVVTGQSDWVAAFRIGRVKPPNSDPGDKPRTAERLVFPKEHRAGMFSPENVLKAQVRFVAYLSTRGEQGDPAPAKEVIASRMRELAKGFLDTPAEERHASQLVGRFPTNADLELCAFVAQSILDQSPPEKEVVEENA